ncbi:MAG: DUF5674 family protein [bacterium]|nr:DUF5674 family protein [bacterium]
MMRIIEKGRKIKLSELKKMAERMMDNLVKVVVDTEKEIMVVGGELHSDEEALLLEKGSKQENIWGINIYPNEKEEKFVEFDSIINIRPSFGNKSIMVEKEEIRWKIIKILKELIDYD